MSHSYQQQLPKLPLVPPRTCSKPIFSYAGWLTSSLYGSFSHRAASFSKESIQNSIQVQVLVILGKLSSWAERQLELVVARLHWFSLQQKHCSRSRRRRKRRSSLKKKKKKKKSWKLLSETLGGCIYRPKKNTSLQKEKLLSPDTKYLSLSLSLLCCPHNLLLLLLLLHTWFISSRQCAAAENTNTISHFSNHFQVHVLSTECKTKMWSQKWGVCVTSPTLLLLSLLQQTKQRPPESSNY
jgi:hypothetical protein